MQRALLSTSKHVAKAAFTRAGARRSIGMGAQSADTPGKNTKSLVVGSGLLVGTLALGTLFSSSGKEKLKDAANSSQLSSTAEKLKDEAQSLASHAVDSSTASNAEGHSSEEEEVDPSQAAFNPETGEINWDCPCLGGMAHGPCGEQFKTAFSCFVYSDKEPKGMECVEAFTAMQDCFRAHPDVYAAHDEEEDIEFAIREAELATRDGEEPAQPRTPSSSNLRDSAESTTHEK
ncbi:hypothetical protein BT69DRAFT_1059338 [Atractiella rhizophila]|nr:hypothetical protein BT69DRAFT_1059338 [Atractiella rhizophila]